jgi:heme-degrading monooxygenase HmoA
LEAAVAIALRELARSIGMIIELAQLTIRPGSEPQFEKVFPAAIKVLGGSKGYLSHELRRSVETPNRYALIIKWQTLEDHTVGFRGSPAFTDMARSHRTIYRSPPVVEHFHPPVHAG